MKLDLKRDAILIIPESEADRAYIEDTLGFKTDNAQCALKRICDIQLGFQKPETYVLKTISTQP